MPTGVTANISGYINEKAWADDADKGSAGVGDGLTGATAYDTIEAGLLSLPGIDSGDVQVTRLADYLWEIEFIGPLALTDVSDFGIQDENISGFGGSATIMKLQEGSATQNERYRLEVTGTFGNTGYFRLNQLLPTGPRLEERMAARWLTNVVNGDTVIPAVVADRVYTGRIPPSIAASGKHCILVEHQANADVLGIGGVRAYAGHVFSVCVMAQEELLQDRTDLAAQRLSELFEAEREIALADGRMMASTRIGQVDDPAPDTAGNQWQKLGVVVEIEIEQT